MKNKIKEFTKSVEKKVIAHRRHLHMYPEISFNETETSVYIRAELDKLGIKYTTIANSVIGRIKGIKPGKTVAFRADIDALALQEQNDVPYRSKNNGAMHACGHDGHTAALLGLAEVFAENPDLINGEVFFIFQHAEEMLPGGAIALIENNIMDDIDTIFGIHLWPDLNTGTIGYTRGPMMACTDRFNISLKGQGGHGSAPQSTKDSLLAGTALVQQLQSIISRNVPPLVPAVLSVCYFNSGSAFNIIPESCNFGGTIRTCDEATRALIKQRIQKIAECTAAAYDIELEINYAEGYPALVNDADTVDKAVVKISEITDHQMEEVTPVMGGEDFAYFTQKKPGAYFFVGCRNKEKGLSNAIHTPLFDIDEEALAVSVAAFLGMYFSVN